MVEDRVTDGRRIAQLLASELTGLERPPLDRVGVADADPEAAPSPGGTHAYAVTLDDERIGAVFVHEDYARLALESRVDVSVGGVDAGEAATSVDAEEGLPADAPDREGLSVPTDDEGVAVHVERGAAVKDAVDLLTGLIDGGR